MAALTVAAAFHAAPLSAQAGGARFHPYSNAWYMHLVGPAAGVDTTQLLWEDRLDTVTWQGRLALRRVQVEHRRVPVGGWQRIVNVFDSQTLAPFMTESRQRNGMFVRYEYAGRHVRVIRSGSMQNGVATDSTTRDYDVSDEFIDFYGGLYALVLAHVVPPPGTSGAFRALVMPDTIVDVPWRVTGREPVRGPDGRAVTAWRIEVGVASGPGASGGTFVAWVTDAPPYVLRLTTPDPRGVWTWDEVPPGTKS